MTLILGIEEGGITASLKDSVYFLQKEKKDTFNLDPKKKGGRFRALYSKLGKKH